MVKSRCFSHIIKKLIKVDFWAPEVDFAPILAPTQRATIGENATFSPILTPTLGKDVYRLAEAKVAILGPPHINGLFFFSNLV